MGSSSPNFQGENAWKAVSSLFLREIVAGFKGIQLLKKIGHKWRSRCLNPPLKRWDHDHRSHASSRSHVTESPASPHPDGRKSHPRPQNSNVPNAVPDDGVTVEVGRSFFFVIFLFFFDLSNMQVSNMLNGPMLRHLQDICQTGFQSQNLGIAVCTRETSWWFPPI